MSRNSLGKERLDWIRIRFGVRDRLAKVQEANFKASRYEQVKVRAVWPLWLKHKVCGSGGIKHKSRNTGCGRFLKGCKNLNYTLKWKDGKQWSDVMRSMSYKDNWSSSMEIYENVTESGPGPCGSVGWASSRTLKGHGFNSQSVHVPGLQIWSWIRAHARGNRLVFLFYIYYCFPLFLAPFPSL